MLNGHEYVAQQAKKKNIVFTKEGNCFTEVSDAAGLAGVADTMRASSSVGRLVQVCEHWIYSACLIFALDLKEQEGSGFHYSYSVYQAEYSRNLLFTRGHTMDQVFQSVIDRTRAPLNIKTLKTIFGYKHRPFKQGGKGKAGKKDPRFECVVERPVYDLTVFKVHFGKLTVKIYSKGERVLRVEAVAHNTKELRCRRGIDNFPMIMNSLKAILDRFLAVLRGVDISFIDNGMLETWPQPSQVGAVRVGGLDVNRPRIRAVMEAVIVLSTNPRGFTASELAEKVREIVKLSKSKYSSRHASYDLKKFRGKGLINLIVYSRRYEAPFDGLRTMSAFLVLRDKIIAPLLSCAGKRKTGPKPKDQSDLDIYYENIQIEMQNIFQSIGIAA